MSRIRVWTSEGKWSEEIVGLDKVDFIKTVILREYCPDDNEDYVLLEIDFTSITTGIFDAYSYEHDIDSFLRKFENELREERMALSEVKTLKVRLSTLKRMTSHPYLSAAYNAIIAAACVPATVPAGYCLLLKFD